MCVRLEDCEKIGVLPGAYSVNQECGSALLMLVRTIDCALHLSSQLRISAESRLRVEEGARCAVGMGGGGARGGGDGGFHCKPNSENYYFQNFRSRLGGAQNFEML